MYIIYFGQNYPIPLSCVLPLPLEYFLPTWPPPGFVLFCFNPLGLIRIALICMSVVLFTRPKTTFQGGSFFPGSRKHWFYFKEEKDKRHIVPEQIPQHPVTNSAIGLPSEIIRLVVAGLSWVVPLYTVGSGQTHEWIYSPCPFTHVNNPLTQISHTTQASITWGVSLYHVGGWSGYLSNKRLSWASFVPDRVM